MIGRFTVLVGVGVLAACANRPAEVADAALDAFCPSTTVFTPVTVTGTAPGASLDVFHYAYAGYVTGFCPEAYVLNFTPAQLEPICAPSAPWLQLAVDAPFTTTGTNHASATFTGPTNASTESVTFEATQLDPADAMAPHIVGHFVSQDPAWSFDIAVDLVSQSSTNCI